MIKTPWLTHLIEKIPLRTPDRALATDVLVVGGGLSGLATAYFVLTKTGRAVTLADAGRIAHGASGHNAGMMVADFDAEPQALIAQFGPELTRQAQAEIQSGWDLFDELRQELPAPLDYTELRAQAGFESIAELHQHYNDHSVSHYGKNFNNTVFVIDEPAVTETIPAADRHKYQLCSRADLKARLETNADCFIACAEVQRYGVMNSAQFCHDLGDFLLAKYPDRFQIFQNTPVRNIKSLANTITVDINNHKLSANIAILCTNGYKLPPIEGASPPRVEAIQNHMIGLETVSEQAPTALLHFMRWQGRPGYAYLSRRQMKGHMLHSIGGSAEVPVPDTDTYRSDSELPAETLAEVVAQARYLYNGAAGMEADKYQYKWHGLLGHTPNKVRVIGRDRLSDKTYYNLGCNGIGIIPGIYGGAKVARLLNGERFPASIFDPR